MSPLLYLDTIAERLDTYLVLLGLLAPLHFWLARRLAMSIFDPLFIVVLADWFGFTLVAFMQVNGDIRGGHFSYYVCSQVAFYGGLLSAHALFRGPRVRAFDPPFALVKWVTLFAIAVHVSSTVVKWGLTGVPLFNTSRLGVFAESGGLGIIERFETGAFYILSFSVLLMWIRFRREIFWTTLLCVLWLLVYIALSGSKAALLGLMQVYFLLRYLLAPKRRQSFVGAKGGGKAFVLAAVFSLGVLAVQSQGNPEEVLLGLAFRLVSFGDIYIYAYIDDTLRYIQGDNPFIGLFGGALSTFRLMPGDWLYKNMGLQFSAIVFPDLDYLAGPNPRHNVFGFHFFGWAGLIFSFLIGLVIAYLQARLYRREPSGYLSVLWAFLLYFSLVSLSGDFDYSLSTLSSILISAVVILVPAQLVCTAGLRPAPSLQNAPR